MIFSGSNISLEDNQNYIKYLETKNWFLNPKGGKTRSLNIVFPKILDYIFESERNEISNGNTFIHFNKNYRHCSSSCAKEVSGLENARIDTKLISSIKKNDEDLLACEVEKKIKFMCAGCFGNTEDTLEKGGEIWKNLK